MEHDQRFKTLLRMFFPEFLRLFFAAWADRLDLSQIEWLDKEMPAATPEGEFQVADMVARIGAMEPVPTMHGEQMPWLVLVHVEIESADRTTRIKPRLPRHYHHLRSVHDLPVLPIVIYLNVHLEGIGEDSYAERFWELEVSTFRYLYVGLAGLDGVQYVQGESWLGVALAALMRIPPERVAWLGAEALRRLGKAPLNPQERFLLSECVQAYLPLDETARQEYERMLQSDTYAEVRAMNKTVFEEGIEKGIEKGREEGERRAQQRIALALMAKRFGPPSQELRDYFDRLSHDDLFALTLRIADANSLAEAGLDDFDS